MSEATSGVFIAIPHIAPLMRASVLFTAVRQNAIFCKRLKPVCFVSAGGISDFQK
jgi:hypothetical protein